MTQSGNKQTDKEWMTDDKVISHFARPAVHAFVSDKHPTEDKDAA